MFSEPIATNTSSLAYSAINMFLEPNIATNTCFAHIQCFKDVKDVLFNPYSATNTS